MIEGVNDRVIEYIKTELLYLSFIHSERAANRLKIIVER